jgi:phosphatidylglycerophosphate synthase
MRVMHCSSCMDAMHDKVSPRIATLYLLVSGTVKLLPVALLTVVLLVALAAGVAVASDRCDRASSSTGTGADHISAPEEIPSVL